MKNEAKSFGWDSVKGWTVNSLMFLNLLYIMKECGGANSKSITPQENRDTGYCLNTVFSGMDNPYTNVKIVWAMRAGGAERTWTETVGNGLSKKYMYVLCLPWDSEKHKSAATIKSKVAGWTDWGVVRGYLYWDAHNELVPPYMDTREQYNGLSLEEKIIRYPVRLWSMKEWRANSHNCRKRLT